MGISLYPTLSGNPPRVTKQVGRWNRRWGDGPELSAACVFAWIVRNLGVDSESLSNMESFSSSLNIHDVRCLITYLRRVLRDSMRGGTMAEDDLELVRPFGYGYVTADSTLRELSQMFGTVRPLVRDHGLSLDLVFA